MTMDQDEVRTELDQISMRLQEDGLPPGASVEERQRHLWQQLLAREANLQASTQELQMLRTQQASEMKEVENYVAHIRGLLEERELLTSDYVRDNEHLRQELHHIRQQQESQNKELAEMLAQEDLGEMGLSSPSEQVAYLLVERATLLERLEAAERSLESQSLTGNLREVQHKEHIRYTMGEELRQQTEDMQKNADNVTKQCSSQSPWKKLFGLRRSGQSKHNITPAHSEQISQERNERQRLERDLEEASRRLAMAHQDIRRLTDELDASKNNNLDLSGSELQGTAQEVENLRKEVEKLKHCDMKRLQQAKEQNDRLDVETRDLRQKVRILESEKKNLLDQLAINDPDQDVVTKEDRKDKSVSSKPQNNLSGSSTHENDHIHKRCYEGMEDRLVQMRELQRQLQRLRKEQEELEERNEELEALLGEAQNASKGERHRHEGELEGLHRRIKGLEAELKKQDVQEKMLKNGEEVKATESYLQLHLRDSSQERLALLEARLTEEKDWRKQLEVDLSAAQAALKKSKEALQIGERELKKLRLEVNSLQTECQQGKTLIKSLTQVKGEKAVLEEKVAQMERAHSRLQSELEHYKDSNRTQEVKRENRLQVDQLQEQADRLTAELSSLQTAHNTLREEMVSERLQTAELQAKLSCSVQEKLTAEGERERLELEIQRLKEQLKWHQEQLSSTKEALIGSQKPAHAESRLSPVDRTKDEGLDQLIYVNQELNHLQTKLEEESQLASQHQLALQAQVNEAQARIKFQDSVLCQKAEEAKQMKQDLQRAQGLFTSAERELRYEKEKNMDLKRHNTLLDQEKLKLCAELKQVQTKLVQVEQSVHTQVAECERQQQKIRELELELARNSTNRSTTTSLQEDLQAERARLIAADKKVLELQQQLKTAQHQLRVEEARAGESSRLERDSRDLSDNLSALRAQQQEEHITRKLLEQREEELQQQMRSLRLKESSLTRTNSELCHRIQQLDTRLAILEAELSKAREEARDSQKSSHRLQEDLMASQQECDRLQVELHQVLLQLDTHIRKYNEKQSQHKIKLRQAKHVFIKETAQRDRIIQKLENDLALASSLSHKEKERIHTVTEENEKLLEEKRELLRKISEAEEMGSKGMRTASTVQHRVNVLEVENRQLQDRTLKLSNQVSSLERTLRNVQSFYSLENAKKVLPSESLCDGFLHTSTLSLTSGSCDPLDILDAICRVKIGGTQGSVSTHQPSEQGYLNLTSPLVPPDTKGTEGSSNNSEQV
ncbi:coiled-coil domain-containing protein 30 isoform X1 [Etheostoma spectabile]|uniref:coiled-coil domain-containing protein 30 isoform X1 n=1 Tax=Etheostoma spectabile TaxID=54343 RepID=UPI0013AEFF2A|nr:coiled-coil domain-containing protein 30-like isoform X1 [Etheostoma spectabile]XP_032378008.1 coiled-coil domain-containing protein 30-like isoform X1 [Etheostoma spectabile]